MLNGMLGPRGEWNTIDDSKGEPKREEKWEA